MNKIMSSLDELLLDADKICLSEFIKDKLYFVSYKHKIPTDSGEMHYFTFDNEENNKDSEDLNLGSLVKQIKKFEWVTSPAFLNKILVFSSTGSERKRCDDAILIGAYSITVLKLSFDEVLEKLTQHTSIDMSCYLSAISKALQFGFFNINDFNEAEFFTMDKIKLNWVVPNKLLHFSGPLSSSDEHYIKPRHYTKMFYKFGVSTIIRASHFKFDSNPFVNIGLSHYDLGMEANSPSDDILEAFLEICENSKGAVVLNCRDSDKRSGNLISAYLVKHYRLTAREALAWVRLCNFGSRHQSSWLKKKESFLNKSGISYRNRKCGNDPKFPHHFHGIYTYSGRDDTEDEHNLINIEAVDQAQISQTDMPEEELTTSPDTKPNNLQL